MTSVRDVEDVWRSQPTVEGAGVRLRRAFGNAHVPKLDPFLLLDDFHSANPDDVLPGFPWHPHRGMETITYVLEGSVAHKDSLGNAGDISGGDLQWMTAGSGIIHQEMPQPSSAGMMWGLQLWANLPAASKMMDPRYRELTAADIPVVKLNSGAEVRVVAGSIEGTQGPLRDIVTSPEYLDVTVPANSVFKHDVDPQRTAFAYVLQGEGLFDTCKDGTLRGFGSGWADFQRSCVCSEETLVRYTRGEDVGKQLAITAKERPLRFLLVTGTPLAEPVAWYGPIVMNTRAELVTAFREFDAGTFVKKR